MRNIDNEIMAIIPLQKLKHLVESSILQGFDEIDLIEYIHDLEIEKEEEK